jgi:hypothetical protein
MRREKRNRMIPNLQLIMLPHHYKSFGAIQHELTDSIIIDLFVSCPTEKTVMCLSGPQVSSEQLILVKIHCSIGQEKSIGPKTRTICQWVTEK